MLCNFGKGSLNLKQWYYTRTRMNISYNIETQSCTHQRLGQAGLAT